MHEQLAGAVADDGMAAEVSPQAKLRRAVMADDGPGVLAALASGADLAEILSDGSTLLHLAAVQGHVSAVEALIDGGAEIDGRDSIGRTALFEAAAWGYAGVAEILLAHGADPACCADSPRLTATEMASRHGTPEVKAVFADVDRR